MLLASQIAGFFKGQYLKKEARDEVEFLHGHKHKVSYMYMPKVWKITSLQYLSNVLRKRGEG